MSRFAFVGKRVLVSVPVLLGVILVVFLLLEVTPGDAARQVAGLRASEAELVEVREEMGLGDPLVVRYVRYVADVVRGDLGYSYKARQPVSDLISERIEPTVWLLAAAIILSVALAVPLAAVAARRRDTPTDHVIRLAGLVGLSLPSFWIGLMLLLLIALPTGLFPVGGFGVTPLDKARSIVLPATTLAIGMAPVLVRSLRAAIVEVLDSEQVSTARSIGVPEARIMRRFVLRNAAAPAVTILALEVGYLLFGAVIVEGTFALPGIGQGLVLAARSRDLTAIQGYSLVFAVAVVLVFLVTDTVLALLDPRVRITT